ncbi:MAG: thymidine kinase [Bacteroidales bacterium]|nr:thymidine kinase [Bacteroidales bacterium]
MNIEKYTREQSKTGSIEIICGSMFSGKTEELIRRAKRAVIARQKICIFKPTIDIRYSREDVVSHNQISIPAFPVEHSRLIRHKSKDYDVVAIDEAQFFDDEIVAVCNDLANEGKRVIVAGLDMDYLGHPFGPMPALMAIADEVTKARAICMRCGRLATYSYRVADSDEQVLLGEKQEYMPLCRCCYQEMTKK